MSRRLLRRLASMSGTELRWRATTTVRNAAYRSRAAILAPTWRLGELSQVLHRDAPGAEAARAHRWTDVHDALSRALHMDPPRFLTGPGLRDVAVAEITARFPDARAHAVNRAEALLEGRFDLLGYRDLRFGSDSGESPDWHLDPVHQRRTPLRFWSTVPYLDAACGDHKIIWELNRQQHLLMLGRAYWLTGEARYRERAIDHISTWIAANPPLTGTNWASMLELGFRTLSWTWALHLFASAGNVGERPWLPAAVLALDRQLRHIEQNLSHYFSPNTHLIGEALALYVAGRSLTCLRRAETYARIGRTVLVEQISRQIAADGGHLERSTHYHRYTLDFYLLALAVARVTNDPVAEVFREAVSRLARAARLLADDRGRLPHIGDDDGGMAFPMCGRELDDIRDSLGIAAALTHEPDLQIGGVSEEAIWFLSHPVLRPTLAELDATPISIAVPSDVLPQTGYYVSRWSDGTHLVFDAGPHGYENGGHAHSDALSLTLSLRGTPLVIDPGTGSYTANLALRDRLRSSVFHNTLTIDGRSQAVPAGPFHWAHVATGWSERWRSRDAFDYVEGAHDGYAPVLHRRHVFVHHGDLVVIADLIEGPGSHDVAMHWHLAPGWAARASGRQVALLGIDRTTWAVSRGSVAVLSGEEGDAPGWCAPVYGQLEPCTTIRVTTRGELPVALVSAFSLDPNNDVVGVEPMHVDSDSTGSRLVGARIVRAAGVDLFGLSLPEPDVSAGAPPVAWRIADVETDARMLFCRRSGPRRCVALIDGSFAHTLQSAAVRVTFPGVVPTAHVELGAGRGLPIPERSALPVSQVR